MSCIPNLPLYMVAEVHGQCANLTHFFDEHPPVCLEEVAYLADGVGIITLANHHVEDLLRDHQVKPVNDGGVNGGPVMVGLHGLRINGSSM